MLYTVRFFSSKCSLFHNSNVFVSCFIHILYTGCANLKKLFRHQKVKALSCNRNFSGKAISITYSECVFVALVIQRATRRRRFIFSALNTVITIFFHINSQTTLKYSRSKFSKNTINFVVSYKYGDMFRLIVIVRPNLEPYLRYMK